MQFIQKLQGYWPSSCDSFSSLKTSQIGSDIEGTGVFFFAGRSKVLDVSEHVEANTVLIFVAGRSKVFIDVSEHLDSNTVLIVYSSIIKIM
jgi:hypothetical protein